MKRWIGVGLLLLTAMWALLIWSPQAAEPAATTSDADPQSEALAPGAAVPASPPPLAAKPMPPQPARASQDPEQAEPAAPEPASPSFKLPKLPPPEAKGPVAALKLRFGDESPSATSKQHELQLTEALQRTGPPPQSLEDVVCRRSVCRVSWRWKAEHVIPFGQALGALHRFDANPGIDAAGPANPDNSCTVAIYLDITAHP